MDRHSRSSSRVSTAVFWRRRVVVLLVVGVVFGMVFWPLGNWLLDGGSREDAATRHDAADASGGEGDGAAPGGGDDRSDGRDADGRADPERSTDAASDGSAGRRAGEEHGRQADAGPGGRSRTPVCRGEDLTVTARPDRENAPAGRPMSFRVRVRNGGDGPCRIPPDPAHVRLAVLTDSERVLDTDRCPAAISVRPARIAADESGIVTVRWNGRRTVQRCSADAPAAEAGSYSVQAAVLDAFSAPVPFELTSPN